MVDLKYCIVLITILNIILFLQVNQISGDWIDSVEECCMLGSNWADTGRFCESHSTVGWYLIEINQETCQHAATLCCTEQKKIEACATGVENARRPDSQCLEDITLGINEYVTDERDCCKCCQLGLQANAVGAECTVSFLSDHCENAYTECCIQGSLSEEQGRRVTDQPSIPIESQVGGSGMCEMLAGELCDHICSDTQTGFRCACYPGYQLSMDGTSCMASRGGIDNACDSAGCEHECNTDDYNTPQCVCHVGYLLDEDQTSCNDINECEFSVNLCGSGQMCVNSDGSYRCTRLFGCGTGYTLNDRNQCTDINECEVGTANCGVHHQCINLQGTFRCIPLRDCGVGFYLDANFNCEDLNECLSTPCANEYVCINTPGSFTCRATLRCSIGYEPDEDATTCQDVDECAASLDECYETQNCVNTLGNYLCQCPRGYKTDHDQRQCIDVNECLEYAGRVCAHTCVNSVGSFICECEDGFIIGEDTRNCIDVDECDSNPCGQYCTNTYGSFQCYCDIGYEVGEDQVSCVDVNECELFTSGQQPCQYECYNTDGSYGCQCPPGYDILEDHRSCRDIDECTLGIELCASEEKCFNTRGSFVCYNVVCPNYFTATNDRHGRSLCMKNPCNPFDINCVMDPTVAITDDYIALPSNLQINTPQDLITMTGRMIGDLSQQLRFQIVYGNEHGYFRVRQDGHIGTVELIRGIVGPYTTMLQLEMDSLNNVSLVTARSIARIHIHVSQYDY